MMKQLKQLNELTDEQMKLFENLFAEKFGEESLISTCNYDPKFDVDGADILTIEKLDEMVRSLPRVKTPQFIKDAIRRGDIRDIVLYQFAATKEEITVQTEDGPLKVISSPHIPKGEVYIINTRTIMLRFPYMRLVTTP